MKIELVPATPALLVELETWLKAEDDAYQATFDSQAVDWQPDVEIPERGFFCNWNLVLRSFEREPINVQVLLVDGAATGFVDEMDILEVHPRLRGHGLGRVLAAHMLQRAFELGHSVAEIEIAPESALPFWRRMGFNVDLDRRGGGGGIYAFRIFDRPHALGIGPRVPYRIAFHHPSRDWDSCVQSFSVFEGKGERMPDGSVRLVERAYCFDPSRATSIDCVVRVELDGFLLFEDKVKRPTAREIGLDLDPGYVFYFDRLTPLA